MGAPWGIFERGGREIAGVRVPLVALSGIPRRGRCDDEVARERGSAVVTIVGGCALASVLGVAIASVSLGAARSAFVAGVADQAALAAADVRAGLVSGASPCDAATMVAAQDGVRLSECTIEAEAATVTVVDDQAIVSFSSTSRAGPVSLLR